MSYSSYKKTSTPTSTLKDLKSGKVTPSRSVNLRGLTLEEVQDFLPDYINSINTSCCVLIIHGQGYRSEQQIPVIKNYVYDSLPKNPRVLAMCKALQKDGGAGATYLLLSQPQINH
jgi:DNA-nicking Smr family endonuclease